MSGATTRRARTDDAGSIAAVHVATWRTAYADLLPRAVLDAQSESVRAAFWSSYLDGPNWPAFVAQDASGVTGFASCIPCRDRDIAVPTVAELAALYVLREESGRGTGSALLGRCKREASDRGCLSLSLWVLEGNRLARRFYDKHGFELDGARVHDERLEADEVRMRLDLSATRSCTR